MAAFANKQKIAFSNVTAMTKLIDLSNHNRPNPSSMPLHKSVPMVMFVKEDCVQNIPFHTSILLDLDKIKSPEKIVTAIFLELKIIYFLYNTKKSPLQEQGRLVLFS